MTVISVPSQITLKQATQWELVTTTTSPGAGLDGRQQYITRENRTWRCSYLVYDAWGKRASWGAYLAFLDQLKGAANTFTVPVPNVNAVITTDAEPLFYFDGGNMGFVTGTDNAVVIDGNSDITTSALAPAGATIISTTDFDAEMMPMGGHFSHNDFLYRVWDADGTQIKFNPPLRAAISSGATLKVNAPTIRVRLASDDAASSAHQFNQIGGAYTLSVVEAFQR